MAYIKHNANLTWRWSPTMSAITITSCKCEVTTETLHNLGWNPCCKYSTKIWVLRYTFKYCGAMALPAAWPFDAPIIRGMAVMGALVLLPMPMSTKCEMLSYPRMPTQAYAPEAV
jgi:hypothetical protein